MEKALLNKEIGGRIRETREYFGFTRETLAEKANISVQFLADIETGRKSMTVRTLKNLCESLAISSDYIMFGKTGSAHGHADSDKFYVLLESLSDSQKQDAKEILKIYMRALSRKDAE